MSFTCDRCGQRQSLKEPHVDVTGRKLCESCRELLRGTIIGGAAAASQGGSSSDIVETGALTGGIYAAMKRRRRTRRRQPNEPVDD